MSPDHNVALVPAVGHSGLLELIYRGLFVSNVGQIDVAGAVFLVVCKKLDLAIM